MPLRLGIVSFLPVLLAACTPESDRSQPQPPLAKPRVDMQADPPPPYTYWAPEGAIIRNHPSEPGIWVAEVNGQPGLAYFGDDCGAAERQGWIGRHVHDLAEDYADLDTRVYALGQPVTSDLIRTRLNLAVDETDWTVVRVECG